jgi:hypothetical protein
MEEEMAEKSCSTCMFNSGTECRRYPPVLVATDAALGGGRTINHASKFPNVHPTNQKWCGEYKPAEQIS